MCDVLMLTFWIWSVVLWERALTSREQSRWQFVGAGVLAGLAVLTKYSAITLLPLLPILSILRTRKLGWWLAGLAVPLMMVAGYEWLTAGMYGKGLLSVAANYANTHRVRFPGGWTAKDIVGLAFAGGSLLPVLFFAPWLWRWRTLLAGGIVILGMGLGMFQLGSNLGLIHPWANPELLNRWDFLLQVALLTAGGLHLLLLVVAEVWRRRDIISITLGFWIVSGFLFAIVLNWTVSARSFLPVVPVAAILLVRRLGATRGNSPTGGWWLWPLVPAAAITLSVVMADYQLANSVRAAAEQITTQCKPAGHKLWFEGGAYGTFQYHMEKLGSQRIDVERSLLQPGDVVVVPWFNNASFTLPPGSVGWIDVFESSPNFWMNICGVTDRSAAGFHCADWGPVPFAIGRLPIQDYYVLKVFSRVQYCMQPANPREVQAGDMPKLLHNSAYVERELPVPIDSESVKQIQLASQCEKDGNIEEAIQHYRKALDVDSNNPVALNNLAWILATASQPELRNGEEAVRLATEAVKLTDVRQPFVIGTLAAAYAETGQFSRAVMVAQIARRLALVTGQNEWAAKNDKFLIQYSAGKTAGATQSP
jgi:hypothetical protein